MTRVISRAKAFRQPIDPFLDAYAGTPAKDLFCPRWVADERADIVTSGWSNLDHSSACGLNCEFCELWQRDSTAGYQMQRRQWAATCGYQFDGRVQCRSHVFYVSEIQSGARPIDMKRLTSYGKAHKRRRDPISMIRDGSVHARKPYRGSSHTLTPA